jgi:hypothetical protein
LTAAERQRVAETIAFCADVADSSWSEAVADRAAGCLTPPTWNALFGRQRRGDCGAFADLARAILAGKQKLHDLVGAVAAWLTKHLGGGEIERVVAKELAKRIPIPSVDDNAAIVARALQMLGIALCISRGDPLNMCQSFIDLSLQETKERVKTALAAALDDWTDPNSRLISAWGGRSPGAAARP